MGAILAAWCIGGSQPTVGDLPDAPPNDEFLRRPLGFDYINYAVDRYRPYLSQIRLANRYDYLGNFLAEGFLLYEMDERRPGASRILKDRLYRSLNNLVIAQDSWGRSHWALTVGDEVRTQLTPLTLRLAGFNGMRWDVAFPSNRLTLLVSRGFDSSQFPTLNTFSTPVERGEETLLSSLQVLEENPVLNLAGHWQTRLGDVFRFGATLVNQHQVNTGVGSYGSPLRGSIPYSEMQAPTQIHLRVVDDSPTTPASGAAVYDVFVTVHGRAGEEEVILSSDPDDPGYDPRLTPQVIGGHLRSGFLEVRGEEAVEFVFSLPEELGVRRITIRALLANDFRIEVAQEHPFFDALVNRFASRRTPFQTIVRERGEVVDFSNRREIEFDHGLSTGQTIYGFDFEATLAGLKIRGEYEQNLLYRTLSVQDGAQSMEAPGAWFLNLLKDAGPLEFGAEVFRIDPRYGGGYDSRRGGVILYTDKSGPSKDQQAYSEFPLVDDNDDDDRFADDSIRDYPTSSATESGVFPGLDEDNDNIPDDDKNANGTPDFEEPFLLYYSDPQEFVYGVDMNNNGVIDLRENDDKPDYPYDRDRRGWHAFVSVPGLEGLEGALGVYHQREIVGSGRATSRYLRASYEFEVPRWGRIDLSHDSKRVQDTIVDPVFVFIPGANNNPDQPPQADPLSMADSWVHTSFLGTEVRPLQGMRLENRLQWILNRQLDRSARLQQFTLVNKVDATWRWKRLTVQPMFKHLAKHVTDTRRQRNVESWHQIAPILRADVKITDRTSVQFGQQGLAVPFTRTMLGTLAFRMIDRVDPTRERKASDSVLMFTVEGSYQGYTIVSSTGMQRRHEEYGDASMARARDGGYSRFFVTIIAGLDP